MKERGACMSTNKQFGRARDCRSTCIWCRCIRQCRIWSLRDQVQTAWLHQTALQRWTQCSRWYRPFPPVGARPRARSEPRRPSRSSLQQQSFNYSPTRCIHTGARLQGPKLESEGPTADQGFPSIQGTLFGFYGIQIVFDAWHRVMDPSKKLPDLKYETRSVIRGSGSQTRSAGSEIRWDPPTEVPDLRSGGICPMYNILVGTL